MADNWYVIQTHVKNEILAKINLARQGFEVFLPQYKKPGPRGKGELLLPLFSGYLFAKFDIAACRWQSIHHTIGVSRILGYNSNNDTIRALSHDVVPGLQQFCDERGVVDMQRAFPSTNPERKEFKAGDRVEILKGMFKGHQATYWNSTKNANMVILSLLNRSVRVIMRNEEIALR